MPRIPDEFRDLVIYLYPSKEAAQAGSPEGGTGFLVALPFEGETEMHWVYAVSAHHVITGSPVIRVNTHDGRFDVLDQARRDWIQHPNGDDVAVCPIGLSGNHRFALMREDRGFLTRAMMARYNFGIGDEVFFPRRFVFMEGTGRNLPTVGMGTIAMMPELIKTEDGTMQECFLVEARSIPGYSGSAVIWPIPPMIFNPVTKSLDPVEPIGTRLVGVDVAHIEDVGPVLEDDKRTRKTPPEWVRHNTGMAVVIPAWTISEVLHMPELERKRKADEEAWRQKQKQSRGSIARDAIIPNFTRQDFEDALRRVSRRTTPSQPDEASSET